MCLQFLHLYTLLFVSVISVPHLTRCFPASDTCRSKRSASTFYPDYVYKIHARYHRTPQGKIVYANIKYAIRLSGNGFRDSKMK